MISLQPPSLPPPWVTQPVIYTFQADLSTSPTRDNTPTRTNKLYSPIFWHLSLANPIFTLISALARTHKISAFSSCTPVPVRIPPNWTLIFCHDASRSITRVPPWALITLRIPSRPSALHRTHYRPTLVTSPDSIISLLATSQHCISSMHPCMEPMPSGEALG